MKGNFGMKSAIPTIQSISHKLKRSKGFTKVNSNKVTENEEVTEETGDPTPEHEEPSTLSLGTHLRKPGWLSEHPVFTFCIHKSGQQPMQEKLLCVARWVWQAGSQCRRRQFCNTSPRRDGGIPRRSCYRLYRLPGRITQPGFFARLATSDMHTSMRTAMGPWPAVSGAWVRSTFFKYGWSQDYEHPRTKAGSFECQSHCMGTSESWYSHCLQFLEEAVQMATQVGWMVLEHFFSDSKCLFSTTIFPLMKMSRLRHLQRWQEKQEMPSPVRALLLKFHHKQLWPRLASFKDC